MKLCDTCIYRNEDEYHKPCIVYRDDCEFYEKERGDMSGDLISRRAVDEIKELMTDINGDTVYAVKMSEIRQLPSVNPQEQKWIPVSERLPDSQTEVIVSCRDDSADNIYRYTASGWITTDGEYWIVDNEINPYVIAWMPLPESYKAESEDKG